MSNSNQHKIIEQFQKEIKRSFNFIDKFFTDNNLTIIDEDFILTAIQKHQTIIKDIVIPEKTGEKRIPIRIKYNFVKDERTPQYETVIYYENGMTEKEVIELKNKLSEHRQHIFYLDLLLRIAKRFSNNVSVENQISENSLTNNKSDFSGHRKLVNAIDRLVASEQFKNLQISKHDYLNSTQIKNIKKLFKEMNPGKKVNWDSFFTKLKSKYDYSYSRKK